MILSMGLVWGVLGLRGRYRAVVVARSMAERSVYSVPLSGIRFVLLWIIFDSTLAS